MRKSNQVVLELEKTNRKIANNIIKDIESLILSDMFSLPWDEPELLIDLGIKYDKDDMLMALQLAREIILNKRDLYVGVINDN
jgi:hypothetical protein|tara:strand:+ start:113 stop:361 length:249 start_codon:yes stop_codon:yes gene_type:complete